MACAQILGELGQVPGADEESVDFKLAKAACELIQEQGADFDAFAQQVIIDEGVPLAHRDLFEVAASGSTASGGAGGGKGGKGKGKGRDVMRRPATLVARADAAPAVILTAAADVVPHTVRLTSRADVAAASAEPSLTERARRLDLSMFHAISQVGTFMANIPGAR